MTKKVSGVPPQEPVVTRHGILFERRLLEKALEDGGICPITGNALSMDSDVIILKNPVPIPAPRKAEVTTSVPAMLEMLQNEWDETMLEVHNIKQVSF